MNLNQSNVNEVLTRYNDFVERLSAQYHYSNNISHILSIIIPAFIIKYGIKEEKTILKCFEEVPIIIEDAKDKMITAIFTIEIIKENATFYTNKKVILRDYFGSSSVFLLDTLVHEYNHAINSINNEIIWDDKVITTRTGLSHMIFDKNDIKQFISKKNAALEEIINTTQTEKIISIINSFNDFKINNDKFNNFLYTLKHETGESGYKSNAYYYHTYICKELMNNKTFMPTIENLRFRGNVEDISDWFDNITGIKNGYLKLNELLNTIFEIEEKINTTKFFRKRKINTIHSKSREVMNIIRIFDTNCIYK